MRFVLIHGAFHGAWCWQPLSAELRQRGHEVIAPNLPTGDSEAGAERYAAIVLEAIGPAGGPVVLAGHSLGGLTLPIVAARTPARLMVFLCALLPVPGLSFDQQRAEMDSGFRPSETPVRHRDGSASWPERGAIEFFYHDCEPEVAHAAARRLRRQHWRITQETTPLTAWPEVPSAYIVASQDRVVAPEYGRRLARERLQVEPLEIDSGHSPFLSRPAELAELLIALLDGSPAAAAG